MAMPLILTPAALLLLAATVSAQTAPVAFDDAYTTPQDENLSVDDPGVLLNDDDADGDPLTAILVSSAQTVGTLLLSPDGSFEYEPNGFIGEESFSYKANDGTMDSNEAMVTFTVTPGSTATGYTDEGLYLNALVGQGFSPIIESFESEAVWGAYRSPNTAPSVTSKGITWESPIGVSEVTTGPGPALHGNFGFFALPHGDYLAGPQCATPGVCTDRWKGTSNQALVAIGGWFTAAGQGKVALYLDGDLNNPINLGGGGLTGWRFFGVVAPQGFFTFEFRELEGTNGDAVYIFGDKFTFARLADDPWADVGNGLAGTHGLPVLTGTGTLVGGDTATISLANGLENTTAWLLFGLNQLNLPFKGGVLVPSLDVPGFPLALPTDAAGELSVSTLWPVGVPSGFTSYLQAWIVDPAGPVGFSATNGLSATAP